MTALKDIVFETKHYWVKRVPKGFEVYKTGLTHSTRVAVIGWMGDKGLQRAKDEIARREAKDVRSSSQWHHATKKSPAQLQREIDEALARAEEFKAAKAEAAVVEKEMSEAQAGIDAFPRGAMGLTPDAVRATPEWRAAKVRVDRAFARLRAFNTIFVKKFAKELRAERAERDRAREKGYSSR